MGSPVAMTNQEENEKKKEWSGRADLNCRAVFASRASAAPPRFQLGSRRRQFKPARAHFGSLCGRKKLNGEIIGRGERDLNLRPLVPKFSST
jgi:hypothetical protein